MRKENYVIYKVRRRRQNSLGQVLRREGGNDWLLHSIGIGTRRKKGERENWDHLEKDCVETK